MFKEDDPDHCLVGNHVLLLAELKERPYVNKQNYQRLSESFDPIRVKLRILPASRAPTPKGMNADYYFLRASKKATAGQLTSAIELLKRGLLVQP